MRYTNKYLDSTNLRAHRKAGKIAMSEFGTDPCTTLFGRFKSLFSSEEYQNNNVNVAKYAGHFTALTETTLPMEFEVWNPCDPEPVLSG